MGTITFNFKDLHKILTQLGYKIVGRNKYFTVTYTIPDKTRPPITVRVSDLAIKIGTEWFDLRLFLEANIGVEVTDELLIFNKPSPDKKLMSVYEFSGFISESVDDAKDALKKGLINSVKEVRGKPRFDFNQTANYHLAFQLEI